MPDSSIVARRLMIHGLVQGVAYRASAQAEGTRLGLVGWVRNRHDGAVEALVAGPQVQVENFIAWAHRGPALARVSRIEISADEAPDRPDFGRLPTV